MHAPLDLLEHLEGVGKRSILYILSFYLPSYTQRLQLRAEIWGFLTCTGLPLSSGIWFWTLATHHLRRARSFYWKSWIIWNLSRHKFTSCDWRSSRVAIMEIRDRQPSWRQRPNALREQWRFWSRFAPTSLPLLSLQPTIQHVGIQLESGEPMKF